MPLLWHLLTFFFDSPCLIADDYVRRHSWDVFGLCWRGQLACLERDDELALKMAKRVWSQTAYSSAEQVSQINTFFVLVKRQDDRAGQNPVLAGYDLDDFNLFGEIKAPWIDQEQTLASAILRRAFRKGTWDTSILTSIVLYENVHNLTLESNTAQSECWAWMAEQVGHTGEPSYYYYTYWNRAYEAIDNGTDPRLVHNILAVLLFGKLVLENKPDPLIDVDSPSIQELLLRLSDLHQGASLPGKKDAALEFIRYLHVNQKLRGHFIVADRLAITKAVENHVTPVETLPSSDSPSNEPSESADKQIAPINLNQAEISLKRQIGESIWAKLSATAGPFQI